jgi:hypothetical protein
VAAPPNTGVGELRFARTANPVTYAMSASVGRTGKGSMQGEPDCLRSAFRAGDAVLACEDGTLVPIKIVAHTEGGGTAWFEF